MDRYFGLMVALPGLEPEVNDKVSDHRVEVPIDQRAVGEGPRIVSAYRWMVIRAGPTCYC